jgi:hypothetical protein
MSNLVSPLLGADALVFKPLTDQEQVRLATNTISVRENSNLAEFIPCTIIESDTKLLPATLENNLFEKLDSKIFLKARHGKDKSVLGEEIDQFSKSIIDDVSFKLASTQALEDDGIDSTSPKWSIKLTGPRDEPYIPNNEELVCVMPGYRDPQNKSDLIEREQEDFSPSTQHQNEITFDTWIDVIF